MLSHFYPHSDVSRPSAALKLLPNIANTEKLRSVPVDKSRSVHPDTSVHTLKDGSAQVVVGSQPFCQKHRYNTQELLRYFDGKDRYESVCPSCVTEFRTSSTDLVEMSGVGTHFSKWFAPGLTGFEETGVNIGLKHLLSFDGKKASIVSIEKGLLKVSTNVDTADSVFGFYAYAVDSTVYFGFVSTEGTGIKLFAYMRASRNKDGYSIYDLDKVCIFDLKLPEDKTVLQVYSTIGARNSFIEINNLHGLIYESGPIAKPKVMLYSFIAFDVPEITTRDYDSERLEFIKKILAYTKGNFVLGATGSVNETLIAILKNENIMDKKQVTGISTTVAVNSNLKRFAIGLTSADKDGQQYQAICDRLFAVILRNHVVAEKYKSLTITYDHATLQYPSSQDSPNIPSVPPAASNKDPSGSAHVGNSSDSTELRRSDRNKRNASGVSENDQKTTQENAQRLDLIKDYTKILADYRFWYNYSDLESGSKTDNVKFEELKKLAGCVSEITDIQKKEQLFTSEVISILDNIPDFKAFTEFVKFHISSINTDAVYYTTSGGTILTGVLSLFSNKNYNSDILSKMEKTLNKMKKDVAAFDKSCYTNLVIDYKTAMKDRLQKTVQLKSGTLSDKLQKKRDMLEKSINETKVQFLPKDGRVEFLGIIDAYVENHTVLSKQLDEFKSSVVTEKEDELRKDREKQERDEEILIRLKEEEAKRLQEEERDKQRVRDEEFRQKMETSAANRKFNETLIEEFRTSIESDYKEFTNVCTADILSFVPSAKKLANEVKVEYESLKSVSFDEIISDEPDEFKKVLRTRRLDFKNLTVKNRDIVESGISEERKTRGKEIDKLTDFLNESSKLDTDDVFVDQLTALKADIKTLSDKVVDTQDYSTSHESFEETVSSIRSKLGDYKRTIDENAVNVLSYDTQIAFAQKVSSLKDLSAAAFKESSIEPAEFNPKTNLSSALTEEYTKLKKIHKTAAKKYLKTKSEFSDALTALESKSGQFASPEASNVANRTRYKKNAVSSEDAITQEEYDGLSEKYKKTLSTFGESETSAENLKNHVKNMENQDNENSSEISSLVSRLTKVNYFSTDSYDRDIEDLKRLRDLGYDNNEIGNLTGSIEAKHKEKTDYDSQKSIFEKLEQDGTEFPKYSDHTDYKTRKLKTQLINFTKDYKAKLVAVERQKQDELTKLKEEEDAKNLAAELREAEIRRLADEEQARLLSKAEELKRQQEELAVQEAKSARQALLEQKKREAEEKKRLAAEQKNVTDEEKRIRQAQESADRLRIEQEKADREAAEEAIRLENENTRIVEQARQIARDLAASIAVETAVESNSERRDLDEKTRIEKALKKTKKDLQTAIKNVAQRENDRVIEAATLAAVEQDTTSSPEKRITKLRNATTSVRHAEELLALDEIEVKRAENKIKELEKELADVIAREQEDEEELRRAENRHTKDIKMVASVANVSVEEIEQTIAASSANLQNIAPQQEEEYGSEYETDDDSHVAPIVTFPAAVPEVFDGPIPSQPFHIARPSPEMPKFDVYDNAFKIRTQILTKGLTLSPNPVSNSHRLSTFSLFLTPKPKGAVVVVSTGTGFSIDRPMRGHNVVVDHKDYILYKFYFNRKTIQIDSSYYAVLSTNSTENDMLTIVDNTSVADVQTAVASSLFSKSNLVVSVVFTLQKRESETIELNDVILEPREISSNRRHVQEYVYSFQTSHKTRGELVFGISNIARTRSATAPLKYVAIAIKN